MKTPDISIIMRSYNEGWALEGTLRALRAQSYTNWELIVIDSGSTDGSVDLIRAFKPRHFIQIQPAEYNPSRVMNQGMKLARAERCLFLNADATPQGTDWIQPLARELTNPNTGAVFSRQIPRPDCEAVYACDYERCFGERRESARWSHFFSMVSSGIRKDIWAQRGFRDDLQYAEDDEYTRWCRQEGYAVTYCPDSVVMHSHNYTLEQAYRRSYGDAHSMGHAGSCRPEQYRASHTLFLGLLKDLHKDLTFCLRERRLPEFPGAVPVRWHQRRGKLHGYRAGRAAQSHGQVTP